MGEDSQKKPFVRFSIIWGLAGAFEYPIFIALVNGQYYYLEKNSLSVLALHVFATVLMLFAMPKGDGWFHPRRIWPRAFFVYMLFLPVFGWLIAGILFWVYKDPENPRLVFEEFESEGFFRVEGALTMPAMLDSRESRLYRELDFMPLTDILASDNLNLKRGAIDKLAQLATPEAIQVLLSHRSDGVPEVRFYVTSALTRIKKEIDEELDAAKRQMKSNVYNASGRLHLAKVYLRYVRSGLLDEATSKAYQNEAAHHMEYVIQARECLQEAVTLILELYQSRQDWNHALRIIQEVQDEDGIDRVHLQKQKIEIFYYTRQYGYLIQELKSLKSSGFSDPQWDAAAYLWGAQTT